MYHEWREFSFCARRALSQLGRWSLTRNAPRLLNAFLPRHHPLLACLLFDRAPLNAFQLEGPLFFRLSNKKNRSSQKAMLSRMNFCGGFISLTETDVFHISAEIRKGMNFCSGVISLTEIHVFNIQKYGPSRISVAVSFSLRKFMVSAFPRKNRNSWISVKWFHFPDRNSCFPHLYGKTEIHEFL